MLGLYPFLWGSPLNELERLGRLNPNEKVKLAMEMSEAAVRICAAGIRAENPGIDDKELMEKLRERLKETGQSGFLRRLLQGCKLAYSMCFGDYLFYLLS